MGSEMCIRDSYVTGYSSRQAFAMVIRRTLVNLFRYRYRDIRLVTRAVEDYLRGPQWLMDVDAEQLHGELLRAGYRYSETFAGSFRTGHIHSLPIFSPDEVIPAILIRKSFFH